MSIKFIHATEILPDGKSKVPVILNAAWIKVIHEQPTPDERIKNSRIIMWDESMYICEEAPLTLLRRLE